MQDDIDDGDLRHKRPKKPPPAHGTTAYNNIDNNDNSYFNNNNNHALTVATGRTMADVHARRQVWLSLDNLTLQRYLASMSNRYRQSNDPTASMSKLEAALSAIAHFEATYVTAAEEQSIIDEFVCRVRRTSPPR